MQTLLFGLLALVLVLFALRGFTAVNAALLARQIMIVGGLAALGGGVALGARGLMSYAVPVALAGAMLAWRGYTLGRTTGAAGSGAKDGKSSTIRTAHLEMQLDHETGEMRGRVLTGVFAGRDIASMAPAELALLWRDCQFADPQSAQLVHAYLDRVHPTWQEDMARAEGEQGVGGIMTEAEALDILGLKPGATADDIRRAHRELMMRLHPDRGGSTYLAARINEAKDLLTGKG